ncbi:MAG: hypothetical protein HYY04_10115 [Chloroflexi bacterium]|nr:hypothetical protein [Chloroflexota bacterium]
MDGLALATEIRRLRHVRSLPLVMLTSPGWHEADPRLSEFAAFLTKPVKASQLYNTLADRPKNSGHRFPTGCGTVRGRPPPSPARDYQFPS